MPSGSKAALTRAVRAAARQRGGKPQCPIEPIFESPRVGDVRDSQASIEVAGQRLGYQVLVPFEEGVRRTVSWYRDAPADLLLRP